MLLASWLCMSAASVSAQSTTATIRGHVADDQGLPLPGVTVSVTSPNLQGTRVAVTSENGDFILTLLPSGTYTISFELSSFQRQQRTVSLAPTQDFPIELKMGPATVTEEVQVVGRAADVLTNTAQVATNFKQELIATLPTVRDLNAVLLLSPAVHPTGPAGAFSIAGSPSFENLFMVNGVTVNENLRGQASDNLYIEDAIQETTVASGGISAEYGRFTGGVVNVITKSGGNTFSGSFRDTLINDKWRTLTPFEKTAIETDPAHRELRTDVIVPTYEYTFGGPVLRDRLWFFTAGRLQTQEQGRTLVITNIPYQFTEQNRRFEGKLTYSLNSNHRLQGSYNKLIRKQLNNTFNTSLSMDVNSLYDRELPEDLSTVNYTGILTSSFFVEGRFSTRNLTITGDGATSTDRIDGTLLLDRARGQTRYWSATFCGVCTPEERDSMEYYVKGSYFLSASDFGSHNMVFGYDNFDDTREANNHQSGSDYRIIGTTSTMQGSTITPVFLGDGTTVIQWNPIPIESEASHFRTHSLFYNDNWRINTRLTATVGVRWDKNDGTDQQGVVVADDSAFSPRFGVVWNPTAGDEWSLSGSVGKYVAAISNSIADSTSAAGNPRTFQFVYRGPDINENGPVVPSRAAIQQVFNWFEANGGPNLPFNGQPTIPGITPQLRGSLRSPSVWEYAGGVSRHFGARAAVRADATYRNWYDFYISRTDLSTGRVADEFGRSYDLTLVENSNDLKRRYAALSVQGTYRVGARVDVGGNYTLSRLWGNFDGENQNSGPTRSDLFQYPEFKREEWWSPEGDLSADQRHRSHIWVNAGMPWVDGLTLSLLQALESGVPYNANSGSGVNANPYVTNPGYLTPPAATATTFYYSERDAFRLDGMKRTDFSASYAHRLPGGRGLEVFGQVQVINIFNQFQLCGCGQTVFQNGGVVNASRIDQTVRTSVTHPALYRPFNPFTTQPVRGANWDYGPLFGTALERRAYTSPRQFRLTFGVRF
jgi:outer membrane receptor for ferrienterochelin and colicin